MGRFLFFVIVIAGVLFGTWYVVQRMHGGVTFPAPTGKDVVLLSDIITKPDTYVGENVAVEGTLGKDPTPTHAVWFVQDDGGVTLQLQLPRGTMSVSSQQEGKKVRAEGLLARTGGDLVLVLR